MTPYILLIIKLEFKILKAWNFNIKLEFGISKLEFLWS